ncbi:MAG: tyrosine--tRNA ligase [Patescibacteria group bacterium]|nr:tyrosine--tRNA ligase [Patescibacteria group bacterium]
MKILGKKDDASTDPAVIERFLSRGLENVFPGREAAAKMLASGRHLRVFLGIDPTGPSLHMGHAIPLMKLAELQAMGHEIIMLIGDFTAMIGDPTDKLAARKQLTRREVLANCREYKKQASKLISFSGANPAKVMWNSKWLTRMTFADVVDLASKMTVDQMLKRDMFRTRMEAGKPVFIHEFLYPLMQGYDSVAMDVDGEIGGNDQTFNMLAGRDLIKELKAKDKLVFATKLLTDPTGKKMGKTEGNMITLADSPSDMFGKVMSWSDDMIVSGYELCTRVSDAQVEAEKKFLDDGGNPRDAKLRLAVTIVELYHGRSDAEQARDSFLATFSSKSSKAMPADAPEAMAERGAPLAGVVVKAGIVSSKTDFRRLVDGGSIENLKTGEKISDFRHAVTGDLDLRIGSHRFIKIRMK